jgi:hypothetical protein
MQNHIHTELSNDLMLYLQVLSVGMLEIVDSSVGK